MEKKMTVIQISSRSPRGILKQGIGPFIVCIVTEIIVESKAV